MRLAEFLTPDDQRAVGVVHDDYVSLVALATLRRLLRQPNWRALVERGEAESSGANGKGAERWGLDEVRWQPLLVDTGRVFAIGLNYDKVYPAGEQPRPTSTQPLWFSKVPGTLVGHEQPVVAPVVSPSFDYEAELAAVIGVGGRHIAAPDALDHVAGYSCLNDGSVRDWQQHSISAGKNFERSGSIGPWMVTADEVGDPQNLRLQARVDGEVRQYASTGEMIFSVAEIIAYLSKMIELRPGDVIATGSPEGTGGSFDPPRYLVPGQRIEVEIERVGVLANNVIAEDPG